MGAQIVSGVVQNARKWVSGGVINACNLIGQYDPRWINLCVVIGWWWQPISKNTCALDNNARSKDNLRFYSRPLHFTMSNWSRMQCNYWKEFAIINSQRNKKIHIFTSEWCCHFTKPRRRNFSQNTKRKLLEGRKVLISLSLDEIYRMIYGIKKKIRKRSRDNYQEKIIINYLRLAAGQTGN